MRTWSLGLNAVTYLRMIGRNDIIISLFAIASVTILFSYKSGIKSEDEIAVMNIEFMSIIQKPYGIKQSPHYDIWAYGYDKVFRIQPDFMDSFRYLYFNDKVKERSIIQVGVANTSPWFNYSVVSLRYKGITYLDKEEVISISRIQRRLMRWVSLFLIGLGVILLLTPKGQFLPFSNSY